MMRLCDLGETDKCPGVFSEFPWKRVTGCKERFHILSAKASVAAWTYAIGGQQAGLGPVAHCVGVNV